MTIRSIAPLALIMALSACQMPALGRSAPAVTVAERGQVAGCEPLVRLTTTIGIAGRIGREPALRVARRSTLRDAAKGGANTVVFLQGGPGDSEALFIEAETYRC